MLMFLNSRLNQGYVLHLVNWLKKSLNRFLHLVSHMTLIFGRNQVSSFVHCSTFWTCLFPYRTNLYIVLSAVFPANWKLGQGLKFWLDIFGKNIQLSLVMCIS